MHTPCFQTGSLSAYTIIALVCLGLMSFSAISAAQGASEGKINTVYFYTGHVGVLIKQDGMRDLANCGRGDYYILDRDHQFFEEVYSLILAAHHSETRVNITAADCLQGLPRIKHIKSRK